MIVMKFGGTSVGNAEMILQTARLINGFSEQKAVVVSAMSGITDLLVESAEKAASGSDDFKNTLPTIEEKEKNAMVSLFGRELPEVSLLFEDLSNILNGIFLVGELTERALDTVKSFGERISARIVAETLRGMNVKSVAVDATKFLITNNEFGNAFPIFEKSSTRAKKLFGRFFKEGITPIVTGFIGATEDGKITTLGRGGSDFSVTILGRLLDAREVWIWTDVNGVMAADPRIVKDACSLKSISYNEASELSYYGAKVIHPKAILPVFNRKIPVRILNSFNPSFEGTVINDDESERGFVKAITRIKGVSLIDVNGKGMLGIPGIAGRVFRAAAHTKSNVLMISQSSSEQNICFAVQKKDVPDLIRALKKEFSEEVKEGAIEGVNADSSVAIVSAVGAGIKSAPNVSGKIFSSLGRNGINVVAIAQGSSDYNISFAVKEKHSSEAVKLLHTELGLFNPLHKARKVVNVVQFGTGTVGGALFKLIREKSEEIAQKTGIEIRYSGLVRNKSILLNENVFEYVDKHGFNLRKGTPSEERILNLPVNTVLVDVTNSDSLFPLLIKAIESGMNVVTSNEKNIVDFDNFKALTEGRGIFKYEATVGAALPVIKTVKSFIESGDRIIKITALPSSFLSYIFGSIRNGISLLSAIKKAQELGYTEPNSTNDLKGTDIYREGRVLMNLLGRKEEIVFDEFVRSSTVKEFGKNELKSFENRIKLLKNKGVVFPALEISDSGAYVKLSAFSESSSFSTLLPGENIFEIYTERYGDVPIVIKGKGVGAEITASGVLNDIIEVGREI